MCLITTAELNSWNISVLELKSKLGICLVLSWSAWVIETHSPFSLCTLEEARETKWASHANITAFPAVLFHKGQFVKLLVIIGKGHAVSGGERPDFIEKH